MLYKRKKIAIKWVLTITIMMFCSLVFASDEKDEYLKQYILGDYQIIGKSLDSKVTYCGIASIYQSGSELTVKRIINGKTIVGKVSIEKAGPEKISVLRTRFSDSGADFEQTCLVSSDLDNYARITCYLYSPGKRTDDPGLEAYFHIK